MKIRVRHAKLSDIDMIYALGRKTEELNFSPNMRFHDKIELKEFVKKPKDNILLAADCDGKIAGFLYAKIVSRTWCILDNLAVEKEFRGHGIGNSLLHEFYTILKKRKVHYVQVLEEIHHKKTRKFWHDRGFKEEKIFVWADKMIK